MSQPHADHASSALIGTRADIAPVRLRPTASNRGGAWGTLGWVSAAALALSAGWFLYALLRPLESPEASDAVQTPPRVELLARSSDIGARQGLLAGLTAENVFSHKRRAWSTGTPVAASEPGAGGEAAPGTDADTALAPEAAVPPDLKPAYDNLRLVGLFEIAGKPAVMVTFAQGADPSKAKTYRVGEEFIDAAHPSPAWKVMGVDLARKSAVLSRGGRQVELRMFANVPTVAAEPVKPGSAAPAPAPTVVPSTRAEVLAKLREAKISEADIAVLMKDLGPDPEEASAADATARALEKVLKPADGAAPDGAGAPPAGLEEVLRMMAQRRKPGGAPPTPADPAPGQLPPSQPPASPAAPKP